MTMKKKSIFYTVIIFFCCIFSSCDDGCSDAAIDYGITDSYDVTKKIFDVYKDKKYLVLKNENGDTLNLKIKYSIVVRNDTLSNTFNKSGKLCTAEVKHIRYIRLELLPKDSIYYSFYLSPNNDFDYGNKSITRLKDDIYGAWLSNKKGSNIGNIILEAYFDNPQIVPLIHKNVIIHGKNVEVIDTKEKIPEQVFIHEDKGIVAMIIPNHGSGYWVVDKIE